MVSCSSNNINFAFQVLSLLCTIGGIEVPLSTKSGIDPAVIFSVLEYEQWPAKTPEHNSIPQVHINISNRENSSGTLLFILYAFGEISKIFTFTPADRS